MGLQFVYWEQSGCSIVIQEFKIISRLGDHCLSHGEPAAQSDREAMLARAVAYSMTPKSTGPLS